MKKILIFLLILLILPFCLAEKSQGQTMQTMLDMFRVRIGERDSTTSVIPDTSIKALLNMAMDKQVRASGYLPKVHNVIYNPDSSSYELDTTFKHETGVIVRTSGMWEPVLRNPNFTAPTDRFSYDIKFHSAEQARMYVQGRDLYEGDTIRVFYAGRTPWLVLAGTVVVANDDMVRIVEEALIMFEASNRSWQAQKLQWDQLRFDMGALKPPEREQSR